MAATGTNIPLFDLQAQYLALREQIDACVAEVVPSIRFILGPEVEELENALARFTGARHAITVANGTDALMIALLAADIGPGDAVFVPSFTFVATAGSVINVGATPVFVDVDQRTFNLDPAQLTTCIDAVNRAGKLRPKAVMPVDLFGLPADYPEINHIAAQHDLTVVADAAQSVGGAIGDRQVGALTDLTATSFYPTKPLGCYGDGGCIFTDNDDLAERIRLIRTHGLDPATGHAIRIGRNSRLDTIQAAILLVKLQAFPAELAARNQVAGWYENGLQELATPPLVPDGYHSTRAVYSILVDDRDRLRQALTDNGIGTGVYYTAGLHLQSAYATYGDGPGSLPVTEQLSERIIALPMSAYVSEESVERICGAIAAAHG